MSGWTDGILQMQQAGYVPTQAAQTDRLSRFNRALEVYKAQNEAEIEKRRKEMQTQADMYKTLRSSGYEPHRAYDAVQKNKFPDAAPTDDSVEQQKKTADLYKTQAEVLKINAETDKAKALTKESQTKTNYIEGSNRKKKEDEIWLKAANDQPLTTGEQRVYIDTISKRGTGDITPSQAAKILSGTAAVILQSEDPQLYQKLQDVANGGDGENLISKNNVSPDKEDLINKYVEKYKGTKTRDQIIAQMKKMGLL